MVFSICKCKFMVFGFHHYARSLLFFSYSERIKINDKEEDEFPKRSKCIAAIKANSYNVMAWDTYYRRWKAVNIKSTFDNLLDNEEYAVRRQLIEEKTQTAIHQRQMQIHKKQEEYSAIGEACLKDVISSGNENEIFLIDDKEYKEIKDVTECLNAFFRMNIWIQHM